MTYSSTKLTIESFSWKTISCGQAKRKHTLPHRVHFARLVLILNGLLFDRLAEYRKWEKSTCICESECSSMSSRCLGNKVHQEDDEEEVFQHSATCCITGALEHQADFQQSSQEKSAIFKLIQESGHLCFFLPKFHSELNPIERYWAFLKAHTRKHCRFNIGTLEETMLSALNQDCKSYIKRIFETSLRYVLLYAAGLKDQDAMKLSEAISDARQTMAKVHFFALELFNIVSAARTEACHCRSGSCCCC